MATSKTEFKSDETKGYLDRIAGFYDKWYRYNRNDDGAAYDAGCRRAISSGKVKTDSFTLIEASGGVTRS